MDGIQKNSGKIRALVDLTKFRMVPFVFMTALISFYLAVRGFEPLHNLLYLALGASLVAAGASALNHLIEKDYDAKMPRTENRPLVKGIFSDRFALLLGLTFIALGSVILYMMVNALTAFIMFAAAFTYVVVYTPLKRVSWLNTTIGAIPGALPTLAGWAAAKGELSPQAWTLFFILFFWQHAHFYPICLLYKDDYARAGFKMLSAADASGTRARIHTLVHAVILIPVSLLPVTTGMAAYTYQAVALMAGSAFAAMAVFLLFQNSSGDLRTMVRISLLYLPVIIIALMVDAKL